MSTTTLPTTFREAEVILAQNLQGYETRPQQQALAEAIENALGEKRHLLAEAGTGTGKSLGYLIPAILSGKRVIVATATKALQNQVWEKDIPFLGEHLGINFSAAILKGRSNYLCVNKLLSVDPADVPNLKALLEIAVRAPGTPGSDMFGLNAEFTGEREDLGFEIENREWMKIAGDTEDCGESKCNENINCYGSRAKLIAQGSQIVVVNHALYMTELKVKDVSDGFGTLIGEHDVVVFDEAHEIEDYATNALGFEVKEVGIRVMLSEVKNVVDRHFSSQKGQADQLTAAVSTTMRELWDVIEDGRITFSVLEKNADEFVNFSNSLTDLHEFLDGLKGNGLEDRAKKQLSRLTRRTKNASQNVVKLITESFDESVRWIESDSKGKIMKFAPINVGPYLSRLLFDTKITAILVSATLSIGESFSYIAGRLGIEEYGSLDVGTPFDYQTQAQTYVPMHLPDPGKERGAWSSASVQEMLDLVRQSEGRALLLFTSISEMRGAYEAISSRVPHACLMQGQVGYSNKRLAEEFKADENSILFATKSFMTGVDFQGDTLKLVVINKLPFPVPTEPVVEARCESIKRNGGNDFFDYTIPVMSLVLKQAYGRLIRHRNDSGVVAILDPRLETKGYGKRILRSLPDAPVIHRQDELSLI